MLALFVAGAAFGGVNPHPVRLVRPKTAPLSEMALLGKAIFFDTGLSSSGRVSCASCHSPARAYGPPGGGVMPHGFRAIPSLMYSERRPSFRIGPDEEDRSGSTSVPQGGLFWDGRADTLQAQALSPLLNPDEMNGGSIERIAEKLRVRNAARFVELFGAGILRNSAVLVNEALFAVGRYQIEDRSFHPYSSKYDAWLEGNARLSPAELRGLRLFEDPHKGNCAACHRSRPTPDGLPPLFTDYQYEALAVPRNRTLAANRNSQFYDLGLCGPLRHDLATQSHYCGMFGTPTLRNVAKRHTFFHNGVYRTLREVLEFYNLRAVAAAKIYRGGKPDDLPAVYRRNIDSTAPFDRKPSESPPLSARDEDDIIAFLGTLDDGYNAAGAGVSSVAAASEGLRE